MSRLAVNEREVDLRRPAVGRHVRPRRQVREAHSCPQRQYSLHLYTGPRDHSTPAVHVLTHQIGKFLLAAAHHFIPCAEHSLTYFRRLDCSVDRCAQQGDDSWRSSGGIPALACEPQLPSFINSPLANTKAAVNVAFMYLSDTEEGQNDGSSRAIEVVTRPGSFVDPLPPAAVAACTTLTASVIIEAVMKALAQAAPERVVAGFARRFRLAIGGSDRNGRKFIWHTFANRGGAGGHAEADGWSNLGVIHNPGGSPSPSVERTESSYPFLIERYALRSNSGGDGKHRGGLGGEYILRYEGSTTASITPTGDGAVVAPYGLAGGEDGMPHRFFIERDGKRSQLGAKDSGLTLHPGDRLICLSAGGGGHGQPAARSVAARERDLAFGYVSSEEEGSE